MKTVNLLMSKQLPDLRKKCTMAAQNRQQVYRNTSTPRYNTNLRGCDQLLWYTSMSSPSSMSCSLGVLVGESWSPSKRKLRFARGTLAMSAYTLNSFSNLSVCSIASQESLSVTPKGYRANRRHQWFEIRFKGTSNGVASLPHPLWRPSQTSG